MYYYEEKRLTRAERIQVQENEILDIIRSFYAKHQYSPTIREIAKKASVTSTSSVLRYLNKLQEKGLIDWKSKAPRTIRIVEEERVAGK
jgi:SOS-response transcriptional repressor LexA